MTWRNGDKCVHVTGLQPFASHDATVDPAIKELTITFDKALDPTAGYTINPGPRGMEHFPFSVRPEFLAGNKAMILARRIAHFITALNSWCTHGLQRWGF